MDDDDVRAVDRWRRNLDPRSSWPDYLVLVASLPPALAALASLLSRGVFDLVNSPLGALRMVAWFQAITLALAFGCLSMLYDERGTPSRSWARGWWLFTLQGSLQILVARGWVRLDEGALNTLRGVLSTLNDGFFLYAGLLTLDACKKVDRKSTWRPLAGGLTAVVLLLDSALPKTPVVLEMAFHRTPDALFTAGMLGVLGFGHWRLVGAHLEAPEGPSAPMLRRIVRVYLVVVYLAYALVQLNLARLGNSEARVSTAVFSTVLMLLFATALPVVQTVKSFGRKLHRVRLRAAEAAEEAQKARLDATQARDDATQASRARQDVEEKLAIVARGMESGSIAAFHMESEGRFTWSNDAAARLFGYKSTEELRSRGADDPALDEPAEVGKFRESVLADGIAQRRLTLSGEGDRRVVIDLTGVRGANDPPRIHGLAVDATAAFEDAQVDSALRDLAFDSLDDPEQALERFLSSVMTAVNADGALLLMSDVVASSFVPRKVVGGHFKIELDASFKRADVELVAPMVILADHASGCPFCSNPRWRRALLPDAPAARGCIVVPFGGVEQTRGALWLRFTRALAHDPDRRTRLERFAGTASVLLDRLMSIDVSHWVGALQGFDPNVSSASLDETLRRVFDELRSRVQVKRAILLVREPPMRPGCVRVAVAVPPVTGCVAFDNEDLAVKWNRVAGRDGSDVVTDIDDEHIGKTLAEFFTGDIPSANALLARRIGLGAQARAVLVLLDRQASGASIPFCVWDADVTRQFAALCSLILASVDLNTLVLSRWRYVVHELSSPLVGVLAEAERAQKKLSLHDDPAVARHLEAVLECGAIQKRLLDSMEAFDATSAMRPAKTPTHVVKEVIGPVISELRQVFRARGFALDDVRVDPRIGSFPKLNVDPELLRIAFFQLLRNAAKYGYVPGEQRKPIEVTGRRLADGGVELVVRDHGIGIPAGWEDHIWVAGVRAENAIELGVGGYGIGLNVLRRIVEAHGGTATVKRSANPTEVCVCFPKESVHRANDG